MFTLQVRVSASCVLCLLVTFSSCTRSSEQYIAGGNKFYERGRYKEARTMYLHALEKNARSGVAYFRLGLAEKNLHHPAEALQALRRAVDLLPPQDAAQRTARTQIAYLLLDTSHASESLKDVESVGVDLLHTNPRDFDGRRLLGGLAFVRAEWWRPRDPNKFKELIQESIDEYTWAERIHPGQPEVRLGLARAFAVSDRLRDAEAMYRTLIAQCAQCPQSDTLYAELYRLLLSEGKFQDAGELLRVAAGQVKKPEWFLVMLAAQDLVLKDKPGLTAALRQIKSAGKEPDRALLIAGDFYLRSGDLPAATREYKFCEQAHQSSRRLCQQRLIDVFLAQGDTASALELNDAILREDPRNSDARARRSAMKLNSGLAVEALNELESVALYDPGNFQVRYDIARAQLQLGQIEQSRQTLLDTIEIRSDFLPAWKMLTQIQFRKSEFDLAAKSISEILAIRPGDRTALLMNAVLRARARNADSLPAGVPRITYVQAVAMAVDAVASGEYAAVEKFLATYPDPDYAARAANSGATEEKPSVADSIYLKASPCDEATARFRSFKTRPDDPFVLAQPISLTSSRLVAGR